MTPNNFRNSCHLNLRVKGKVYKTVVRPATMNGAETLAVKKAQEKKLDVAELSMLRWMSGVIKLDKIRNERIRRTTRVGEISKKVQESRLKWYGHVLRREEGYVGKRVMVMEVPGKRKTGRQSGGGWIASGTTCRRENCQGRTHKTGLNGGVSQDASIPHKSGKGCGRRSYVVESDVKLGSVQAME